MRPTWVEVSRRALRHNYRVLRDRADRAGAQLLCVIKADAYGHGLPLCGKTLVAERACWLGVTSVEEGVRLREALSGPEDSLSNSALHFDATLKPAGSATELSAEPARHAELDASARLAEWPSEMARILVMGGAWKGEAEAVIEHRLTPVVWEPYQLDLLEQGARRAGAGRGQLRVHVEVDTGMARQGVSLAGLAALLARLRPETGTSLNFEGLHTHYASAENQSSGQNQQQTSRFCQAALKARKADMWPRYLHGGNSSTLASDDGTLPRLHELARGLGAHLLVRPGLSLFGYLLPEQVQNQERASNLAAELQPVMAWKTRVIGLRDVIAGEFVGYGATWRTASPRKVALLPVGYADGYSRRNSRENVATSDTNSERGEVLVRGCRAPVVGRVSMDLTTVDVTGIPGVQIGDEVTLLGAQQQQSISAETMARVRQTISYEVLCGVGARVRRIAVD